MDDQQHVGQDHSHHLDLNTSFVLAHKPDFRVRGVRSRGLTDVLVREGLRDACTRRSVLARPTGDLNLELRAKFCIA